MMVRQVRQGLMDFIGAARPSIADPFLPKKIEEGRIEDIRECIGCNMCVASYTTGAVLDVMRGRYFPDGHVDMSDGVPFDAAWAKQITRVVLVGMDDLEREVAGAAAEVLLAGVPCDFRLD